MTNLIPTPAAEWRRAAIDGEVYTLPGSGRNARLRTVSLLALAARAGTVPNPLAHQVLKLEGVSRTPKNEQEQITNYREFAAGYAEVAKLCFVEPRVVDEPNYDAGEIAPADLTEHDLIWLYGTFVKGVADDRARFLAATVAANANAKRDVAERLAAYVANDGGADAS